jgi:protein SCO1
MSRATAAATTPRIGERLGRWVSALVARPAFWAGAIALLAVWPVVWALRAPLPPPPPVLGTLPAFRLTDQDGASFGSRELDGKVWVASFIFTRCTTVCPAVTATMARIQDRTRNLEPAFHLVSFSVDPTFDTPDRLATYARVHRASPRLWTFLTGPEQDVQAAVVKGLRETMGREGPDDGAGGGILHGTHLVLVDARGRVRAYYSSDAPDVVDRVVRDAALLVNRG